MRHYTDSHSAFSSLVGHLDIIKHKGACGLLLMSRVTWKLPVLTEPDLEVIGQVAPFLYGPWEFKHCLGMAALMLPVLPRVFEDTELSFL